MSWADRNTGPPENRFGRSRKQRRDKVRLPGLLTDRRAQTGPVQRDAETIPVKHRVEGAVTGIVGCRHGVPLIGPGSRVSGPSGRVPDCATASSCEAIRVRSTSGAPVRDGGIVSAPRRPGFDTSLRAKARRTTEDSGDKSRLLGARPWRRAPARRPLSLHEAIARSWMMTRPLSAPDCAAVEPAAGDEADHAVGVGAAGGTVQFGGVGIRMALLDPGGRVGGEATHRLSRRRLGAPSPRRLSR